MDDQRTESSAWEAARKRVVELRRFYLNVVSYLVVNLGLFAIDMLSGGETWFYWPLGIWGALLLLDGLSLFMRQGPFGANWEERKTRELLERDRGIGGTPRRVTP